MTTLITNSQFKQFDANGVPLAAGKVYTYEVGTTTPKVTYEDQFKVTAHTNPIILDSWGEATIWIDGDTKFIITDSDDAPVRVYDSFVDTPTSEDQVISSPIGAIYRSLGVSVGYIRIRLPMNYWPNTRVSMTVLIYDEAEGAIKLDLSGYASSSTNQWEETTSVINRQNYTINVAYGYDGSYPTIYIGSASKSWTNPQVSVIDFFPGQVNFDYSLWYTGWFISISTIIGTISDTDTVTRPQWGSWVTIPYGADYGPPTAQSDARQSAVCRLSIDGKNVQIAGGGAKTGGGNNFGTLPESFWPTYFTIVNASNNNASSPIMLQISTTGGISSLNATTNPLYVNAIFPTD